MTNTPYNDPDYFQKRTQSLLKTGFPMDLICMDFKNNASMMIRWHWHEDIEIMFISYGQAYITCGEDTILACKGDIVIIMPNVNHFITPFDENNAIIDSIIVHPTCLFGIGQLEMENKYINPVIHSQANKYIHISSENTIYSIFSDNTGRLIDILKTKEFGYELSSKAILLNLWKDIFEYTNALVQLSYRNSKSISQDEQRVKQALIFIHEHYTETITLDDIANSIMVSKSECCRCFKRTMTVSPFEYLMKYRILESTKRMTKKPNESISEIAGSVGFNNTSYYNKVFKKYMNCTPTEYRISIKQSLK